VRRVPRSHSLLNSGVGENDERTAAIATIAKLVARPKQTNAMAESPDDALVHSKTQQQERYDDQNLAVMQAQAATTNRTTTSSGWMNQVERQRRPQRP